MPKTRLRHRHAGFGQRRQVEFVGAPLVVLAFHQRDLGRAQAGRPLIDVGFSGLAVGA
jgi:hypothetical protein